jgi:hypothetical protein
MAEEVLFHGKNPEGKIFTLYGDKEDLRVWADEFIHWKPEAIEEDEEDYDYEEYALEYCDKDGHGGRFTLEERMADIEDLKRVLESIDNGGFMPVFLKLPRKKNNSLAKGRVVQLWRGTTFQHYWEDSYGFNAPELSLKSFDDYKARLELTSRVVGY